MLNKLYSCEEFKMGVILIEFIFHIKQPRYKN
jgi:hypothetical protein